MAISNVWIVYLTSAFLYVVAVPVIQEQLLNDQSNLANHRFRRAIQNETKYKMIADGIYSVTTQTQYWSIFVVTSDGVIAIESVNSHHSSEMLKAIKEVTDKPVKYLLQSHNHWDHASGGQVFRNAGAKIIAHAEAYDWMKANPKKDLVLPDEGWCGNRKDITLGGTMIELHYFGMNHGLGMTVFLLPKQKVAYLADIVSPGGIIYTYIPDSNIKEVQRTLNEVLKLDFDRAVFAHNFKPTNNIDGGTKQDVADIIQYYKDVTAAIDEAIKNGTSSYELPNTLKVPPQYKNWSNQQYFPMNVEKILSQERDMGPYAWRPNSRVPSLCVKKSSSASYSASLVLSAVATYLSFISFLV